MSFTSTTNYGLQKPGIGDSGWGDEMNANLDVIDTQIKARQTAIDTHTGTGSAKHSASQINITGGGDVESALGTKATTAVLTAHTGAAAAAHADTAITSTAISGYATVNAALARLDAGKAALHHFHEAENITVAGDDGELGQALSRIDTALAALAADTGISSTAISGYATVNAALSGLNNSVARLQNFANLIEPDDLSHLAVTTQVNATATGITVGVSVDPDAYVRRINVQIKQNGTVVYNGGAGASFTYTHAFVNGDLVTVTPTVFIGTTSLTGAAASLTWYKPGTQQTITLDFIASGTSHEITEADLQNLLGWTDTAGQSVNKALTISVLGSSDKVEYTPHTGGYKVTAVTDNSVQHLDKITLLSLTDKLNYSVQLTVTQINTKG